MRGRKIFGLACLLLLPASLLLARVHPYGDAGLYAGSGHTQFMEDAKVPPEVRAILFAKCADCHSAQTRAPLYGRFAPLSWLMENDILRGRKAMNLSAWSAYSQDERLDRAEEIAQITRAGKMPLLQYRLVHWKSDLDAADLTTLSRWANAQTAKANAAGQTGGQPDGSGDVAHGRELFGKRCTGCHSLTQDGEGPRLEGVVGRTSGSVPTYQYSAALKNAHIVWDENTLDRWLTSPDQMVPGTEMDFYLPKPEERQEIIRYLKSSAL
jgi:cytochrome c